MEREKNTVLIIEDDRDIQRYYEVILADGSLELVSADNGAEALAIIDSGKRIDLILLDIVMPVMNGEEFFRVLRRERGLNTPVICCSVDETRAVPLQAIGPLQGVFLKGKAGNELVRMIGETLAAGT